MQATIEWLNATSQVWTDRFWRATWQAAIVIVAAFALTGLLYRVSPRVRCWIWRLAYVKLILLLFWSTPIELALLPAVARSQSTPASAETGVSKQQSGVKTAVAAGAAESAEPAAAMADGSS